MPSAPRVCAYKGPRGGTCKELSVYRTCCAKHQTRELPQYEDALNLNGLVIAGNLDGVIATGISLTSEFPWSSASQNPLVLAATHGHASIVSYVLQVGGRTGMKDALIAALDFPNTVLQEILKYENDISPQHSHAALCVAVSQGKQLAFRKLLQFGAPIQLFWQGRSGPDYRQRQMFSSALYEAAANLDEDVVIRLVGARACTQSRFRHHDLCSEKRSVHTPAQKAALVGFWRERRWDRKSTREERGRSLRIVRRLMDGRSVDLDDNIDPAGVLLKAGKIAYEHAVRADRKYYGFSPEQRRDALELLLRRSAFMSQKRDHLGNRIDEGYAVFCYRSYQEVRVLRRLPKTRCSRCDSNLPFRHKGAIYFDDVNQVGLRLCLGCMGRELFDEVGTDSNSILEELRVLQAQQGLLHVQKLDRSWRFRHFEIAVWQRGEDRDIPAWTADRIQAELEDMAELSVGWLSVEFILDRLVARFRAESACVVDDRTWSCRVRKVRRRAWKEIRRLCDVES
eukprot:TRINITY_DN44376_c0_g1_i1.p1 TRINITY_DN44376_c0_g1~~TRINITY_DN44376_c0_g1_i1.p1  ORF type:complete len:525 (-),score=46.06 TRINITY_DN44376_c0_g1_i1:90-1622(-)